MQRAATGLATVCLRLLGAAYGRRVALLVGTGNNGGDALFAGAVLARRGVRVTAVLLGSGPGARGAASPRSGGPAGACSRPAHRGGGGHRPGRPGAGRDARHRRPGRAARRGAAELARAAADGAGIPVAVDVPSGVDADTGAVDGVAFAALHTVTFGAVKPGLVVGAGRGHAGRVHLVDIGLGPYLPPADRLLAHRRRRRRPAGSRRRPGTTSTRRASSASSRGRRPIPGPGCCAPGPRCAPGRASSATPGRPPTGCGPPGRRRSSPTAVRRTPDGCRPGWSGPGMGTDDAARSVLAEVLASDLPVVVDADALTLAAAEPALVRRPDGADRAHPARPGVRPVRGASVRGRTGSGAARRLAADLGCVVLLKGDATVVADADGTAFVNATGTSWLATAGTGDVLSRHPRRAAGDRAATRPRRRRSRAHLHGRTGQLAAERGTPRGRGPDPGVSRTRSAGCAGSRRAAWETREA